jgi:hypothetical protein
VLDEFSDAAGRPLTRVLSSKALSPSTSFSRIIFRDGREAAACRSGRIAAFTGPGSRVVFVCGDRFARIGRSRGVPVVIHDAAQLGLGERPPMPGEIDRIIARRCGS